LRPELEWFLTRSCGILTAVVELAYHYTPAGIAKAKKERNKED